MSKVFAVGDIHGCFEPLKEVIEQSNIDASDTVVFLGDYVDRGPQSKDVIEYLIQLKTRFHVIYIMGNHDFLCATKAYLIFQRRIGIFCRLALKVTKPTITFFHMLLSIWILS